MGVERRIDADAPIHLCTVNPRSPDPTRLRQFLAATLWIAALAASVLTGFAARPALEGPFLTEPRGWTPLPGGDFEVGPADLPLNATYGPLVGDMELFVSKGSVGTAQRSPQAALKGDSGVHIRPGRFDGPGIALTYYKTVKLAPGQSVVLSAFVKRLHPAGSQASVALDFWGAPGTTSIPVPATTSEWQFIHGVFSPPAEGGQVTVGARLTLDGNVAPTDEVYVDELSLTPLDQFMPPTRGGALVGDLTPGTGTWDVLPGGDFEAGPHPLPVNTLYGPLIGDMELFQSLGASATAFRTNTAARSGNRGVDLQLGTFQGAGVGVTYYALHPVKSGSSVVLSAWVRRVNPATSKGRVFLDFWDAPGTARILAKTNVAGWQFLYAVFTAPPGSGTVQVGARVGVDGDVTPEDRIFIDELAITPLDRFSPPQSAASSPALGAEGSAILANGFVVGIQLSSGGSGYTGVPNVLILGGGGTGATAVATVSGGVVTGIRMTGAGVGYTRSPLVRIDPPLPLPPEGAKATANLTGGFVTGVTMTRHGSGYSQTPRVQLIGGGGSGATATAVMSHGIVLDVIITNAGSGYTRPPLAIIDPPVLVPAPPFSVSLEVKTVTVTLSVTAGRIYLLESSSDLNRWTTVGDPFEASSTSVKQDFDVAGRPTFFRLRDVTYGL